MRGREIIAQLTNSNLKQAIPTIVIASTDLLPTREIIEAGRRLSKD